MVVKIVLYALSTFGGSLIALVVSLYKISARHSREEWTGRWHMTIAWTPDWIQKMVGPKYSNVVSEGTIILNIDEPKAIPLDSGAGWFELRFTDTILARIAVEFRDVQIATVPRRMRTFYRREFRLDSFGLFTRFRMPIGDFNYHTKGTQFSYVAIFSNEILPRNHSCWSNSGVANFQSLEATPGSLRGVLAEWRPNGSDFVIVADIIGDRM